jgi:hypothetical protein
MWEMALVSTLSLVNPTEVEFLPPAVLVELFTSEGCSSCPPADRLLSELDEELARAGIAVVPLSLHVDYWDSLGWRDPFSSSEFTTRQKRYASLLHQRSIYTPQMVVDGVDAFVGSDRRTAKKAIQNAWGRPDLRLGVRGEERERNKITIEVVLDASSTQQRTNGAALFLAVTEGGLSSQVTRGENAGLRLSHTAVVRKLLPLGDVDLRASSLLHRSHTVSLQPEWDRDRLHVAVWVEDSEGVLGAARAELSTIVHP